MNPSLQEAARQNDRGEVRFDRLSRALYSTDASGLPNRAARRRHSEKR